MAKKKPWVNVRNERPSKRRLATHKRRLNEAAQFLRDGAGADIWYDYDTFDDEDDSREGFITDVQDAMRLAADIIEQKEDEYADDT